MNITARKVPILMAVLLLLPLGCASLESSGSSAPQAVLTSEDVERYSDAYQAVQTLRSQWLRARAPGDFEGPSEVQVYLDGVRFGGPETLRRVSTPNIDSIEYYNGIRASQRWGLGHESGVIFVSTRSR